MPLLPEVVDSVANTNFKNIGEMGAITAGVASQNLVSHQRAMDGLREAFTAESTLQRAGIDSTEAVSNARVLSADLGNRLAEMGAAIASIQQMMKGAVLTPPSTNP